MSRLIAILFGIVLLFGANAPAAAGGIDDSTLNRLFPGTFSVRVSGISATVVAHRGGRLSGKAFVGTILGRWSVRSGRLCIALEDWSDGTQCSAVVQEGDWYRADRVRFKRI